MSFQTSDLYMKLSATHTATPTGWSFPKIACLEMEFLYFSFSLHIPFSPEPATRSISIAWQTSIFHYKFQVCSDVPKHIHRKRQCFKPVQSSTYWPRCSYLWCVNQQLFLCLKIDIKQVYIFQLARTYLVSDTNFLLHLVSRDECLMDGP